MPDLSDRGRKTVKEHGEGRDVVLGMNLYVDVRSDVGAETAGGLGLAPVSLEPRGGAHDSLFFPHAEGLATTLVAKRRVLAHNPDGC